MTTTPAARNPLARELFARPDSHIHMAGICGVGMAGLAVLLRHKGFTVSGCDQLVNKLAGWLRERKVSVSEGHSPAHLAPDVAAVIRSAAVPESAPEITAALARGIPVLRRGEVLPLLMDAPGSIAVAGTHGKTTTSAFIAQALTAAGCNPSFCIGGEVTPLGGIARAGQEGILVAETDESDGTLALYQPDIAVVTNIEFDHKEHFADVSAVEECFRQFIRNARRRVIFCADDPRAAALCKVRTGSLGYGLKPGATLLATITREHAVGSEFTVTLDGKPLGTLALPVPGRHNILNALACTAVCLELGLAWEELVRTLATVALPRRRFEHVLQRDDLIVISDYAHHPSEIAALIRAAEHLQRPRITGIFQPHRFSRTKALGPDFPASFEGLAELVLTPVYAASEPPIAGGSVWDLYAHCRRNPRMDVRVATSLRQAWEHQRTRLRMGDILLVIGAGDVERIALWARDELRSKRVDELPSLVGNVILSADLEKTVVRGSEPVGPRTTFGTGGIADVWMEAGSLADLAKILAWARGQDMPFRILGGGSNVLVSDLGVRGIVVRLAPAAFGILQHEDGIITAGAALPLARLLAWASDQGLAGLEFLEGIPGTVGGAARGNSGAWGEAIGDRIVWVRALDANLKEVTLPRNALGYAYRSCPTLQGMVITEVGLRVRPGASPETLRQTRAGIAARRSWMKGLRCAGSVFRNPPGDYAGRLIEAAGLKGFSIGGATISQQHANVIVTGPGATSSDVLALLESARDTVERLHGIRLETEVNIWS